MLQKTAPVARRTPALQYLSLVADRLAAIRRDVPKLTKMGERMAAPLLAGGNIFTPDVSPFWPSEFGGRAGGLMGIRDEKRLTDSDRNVAYFTLPAAPGYDPRKDEKLKALVASKAQLFVIGRPGEVRGVAPASRFAGFTGGVDPRLGLYPDAAGRPLASLRELDTFVRGWVTAGEMIAACTRAGKMPVIWMSVWLEGALPRNAHFFSHNNTREPWETPLFHDGHYVPPIPAGHVADAFLSEAAMMRAYLADQPRALATAGQWLAAARKSGRRVWTTAVGHSYPEILELKTDARPYPVEWAQSFSDLTKAAPDHLRAGDVVLHFGYAPVNNDHVKALLARGLKLIHTSPYGNHVTPVKHRNFLYFELPWRPADATVDVPGYSVRILPMSSTAQTMALFAILAEMAGKTGKT